MMPSLDDHRTHRPSAEADVARLSRQQSVATTIRGWALVIGSLPLRPTRVDGVGETAM